MKNLFKLAMVLCFGFIANISFAGLLVEPVVGYSFVSDVGIDGGENYKSGAGISYGGRLGFQAGGLQVGADYLKSSFDMSDSDFGQNIDTSETGIFAGYELPALFRLYGTYIFDATGETEISSRDLDLKSGTGYKLGVGFTLLPFLDINADYRSISFRDQDFDAYMLSLSLPFDFF